MSVQSQSVFEKKNVIIAGGAGFIGSHLCDELIKKAKIICIDDFITGSEENIHHLFSNPDFKFIRYDVTQPINVDAFPELKPFRISFQGIQEVYNLAAPTSPKEYEMHGVEIVLANALGTKNLLDLAVQHKAKFTHLSSSAVYGEPPDNNPLPENYWGFINPIGPRSSYAEGKRFAECMIVNYRKRFSLNAKIIRVFNTFGPRMKLADGRMIPDFVADALEGNDLTIYGDPKSISTFNYVSDLVEGIVKMTDSAELGPLNIGNPKPTTMQQVAEIVLREVGGRSRIVYHDALPYTARQGIADIRQAKEKLGWFPVVPLEEGLRRTIDYMKGSRIMRLEPGAYQS